MLKSGRRRQVFVDIINAQIVLCDSRGMACYHDNLSGGKKRQHLEVHAARLEHKCGTAKSF